MESDEYDDDIADEDLALALTQSGSFGNGSFTSTTANGRSAGPNPSHGLASTDAYNLDDLPTDAFSSSPEPERVMVNQAQPKPRPRTQQDSTLVRSASGSFRQTNLFGETIHDDSNDFPQQPGFGRIYRGDKNEAPSQHALNKEALRTWVYPKNLGAVRDYQYSIVKNGLFNNTLVALPTGLGKTFIAATIMLNYYRWTKDAKIVFVAPTKPLVAQQVDACFNIVGIPRTDTTMLTGESAPALRADEWQSRRVFFMTPQTLLNDISRGFADPKSIVLLVIDEAHRATGEYAYAKVVKQMRRFNPYFRVLALTATPGSKVETVQEVIDNLGISHTEIRTEDSMDIRQYVHTRNIDQRLLEPSDEMHEIRNLFGKALKPLMDRLSQQNIYFGRDPMSITTFGLMKQEQEWFQSTGRQKPMGLQMMMRAIFAILKSLAHSIKILNFHSIRPFYENMKDFRSDVEAKGDKGSKYKTQITKDSNFQEMMDRIESWVRFPDFVGHPKLTELTTTVMNHFLDAQATEGSATRAIVFSEYRDSAEEIVRVLSMHRPLIKPAVFVGQADSKKSAGMKQSEQIRTVEQFKNGEYNVLVATSIGEEGLDIGQVDLIVCYDASSSPIRMLQRMGRTGRKREGNVVLLLMKGKEEDNFAKARDNYEAMQKLICEGSRFNFRHDLSTRIVPRDVRPEVDMQHIEIPIENTQNPALPEPGKRKAPRGKKLPAKKFHMPDGVETGFVKASNLGKPGAGVKRGRPRKESTPQPTEFDELADVPPLNTVVLTAKQTAALDRNYRSLPLGQHQVEETQLPDLSAHPLLQRRLQPIVRVQHGTQTKRYVSLMRKLANKYQKEQEPKTALYGDEDHSDWRELPPPTYASDTDDEALVAGEREAASSQYDSTSDREPLPKIRKTTTTAKRTSSGAVRKTKSTTKAAKDAQESGKGRKKQATRKPAKRKPAARKRGGINSDELGDDCDRESDLLDSDGTDSGGDLVDFVVGDDVPISSVRASSALPSSPTSSPGATRVGNTGLPAQQQPYYVPTQFPGTQESLGELPDIDDVIQSRSKTRPNQQAQTRLHVVEESDEEDGDSGSASEAEVAPLRKKVKGRQQRRRFVFESDESEDE